MTLGPPENRTCTFRCIRLKQAAEVCWRLRPTIRSLLGLGRPRVHSPRPVAVASSLTVGSGLVVIVVFRGSPDHVSALSRPGTGPGIRPVIRDDFLEGSIIVSRFPAAFPPPAFAFWSSCSRPGVGPSLRSADRTRRSGPRRGFHVSHAQVATGVGALYIPGTTVLTQTGHDHQPASAASQRPVPAPRHNDPSERDSASLDINQGFKRFHPSGLPLA